MTLKDLRSHPPNADCYIVGSDQVWSTKLVSAAALPAYFLSFGHGSIRRIAYAASSGGEGFKACDRHLVAEQLKSFHLVGVREHSLCHTLTGLGVENCEWTPDPTVLLDWQTYFRLDHIRRGCTTGVFLLNRTNSGKVLRDGVPAVSLSTPTDRQLVDLSKQSYTPPEWVRSIAEQQLFITDSYHAVLFAIYTRTPFAFIRWGHSHKRDERVLSLLTQLGLSSQAYDVVTLDKELLEKASSVNWNTIEGQLASMRNQGAAFLAKALA